MKMPYKSAMFMKKQVISDDMGMPTVWRGREEKNDARQLFCIFCLICGMM
jgi:hypothetical protein